MSRAQPPPERWHIVWLIVWTAWGTLIGALVYCFDRDFVTGLNWFSAGLFIGSCGIPLLRPLAAPFRQWYQRFQNQVAYLEQVMRIVMEGKEEGLEEEDIRERMERYQASAAFQRHMEESIFGLTMAISPLAGLLYGTLLGGIIGALCPVSPELQVTAGRGAFLGVTVGPVLFAFLVAVLCAIILPIPKQTTRSVHVSRRLALLVSPVLIVPAMIRCLKRVSGRPGA